MNTVYVGTTEAAFLLRLSSPRVRKLLAEGRIEGAFKEGLHWKIPLFKGMPKVTSRRKGPEGRWQRKIQNKSFLRYGNCTRIIVVIEKDETGYYAYCPQLEECQSQGETLAKVKKNIKEVIELYLSTLPEKEKEWRLNKNIRTTTLEVKVN